MRRLHPTSSALRYLAATLFAAGLLALPAHAEGMKLRHAGSLYADSKGASLKLPEGVAVGGGNLYVADGGNGRIVQFKLDAEQAAAVAEWTLAEVPNPQRIAATSKGAVFVLDGKSRRIARVSADGRFEGWVALPGSGFPLPRALKVDASDNLWVLDMASGRLVVLDAAGAVKRELPLEVPRGSFFSDFAVDRQGNVYLLDSVARQVRVLKSGATATETFGPALTSDLDFATALTIDGSGQLLLADQNGGGIVALGSDGSFRGRQSTLGWKEGMLRYPAALAIEGNRLLVADRENNRVQVFVIQ